MRELWNEPVLTILEISETEEDLPGLGDDGSIWTNNKTGKTAPGGS